MTSGARIVTAARSWLGTRFHHQGRLKKGRSHCGGVDCLGLLMGVAAELDLRLGDGRPFTLLDEVNYSHYPDPGHMSMQLGKAMNIVPIQEMQTGDVVLLSIDGQPQHLAFLTELPEGQGLIHAYAPARAVVEHLLDNGWKQRIIRAYRPI